MLPVVHMLSHEQGERAFAFSFLSCSGTSLLVSSITIEREDYFKLGDALVAIL
jgi:hypothetical protein